MRALVFLAASWQVGSSSSVEAGAWTIPMRKSFFQVGFMFQDTTERYFLDGDRIPYFFDGRNRTQALFFQLTHGLTDKLEVEAQIPLFNISFDDFADDRMSTGPGDLRITGRYSLSVDPVAVVVGSTVKFPTGEFVNDAEIVPVGEGQYDFDVFAELGRSLWPKPGWVSGKIGYRWRTENPETGIDFGGELIWNIEFGYRIKGPVTAKLLARGLHGGSSTSFGISIPTLKREAVYVEPAVIIDFDPSRGLELSVPFTVRGRNWPAGPIVNVKFFQRF